jgi:mRNA interferase MazF
VKRGEMYRVRHPSRDDPRRSRVFVIVSRQVLIDSRHATVTCAPVYTAFDGLSTQVPVGPDEGLKHHSSIHCDELISMLKTVLTDYIGAIPEVKLRALNDALRVALDLESAGQS